MVVFFTDRGRNACDKFVQCSEQNTVRGSNMSDKFALGFTRYCLGTVVGMRESAGTISAMLRTKIWPGVRVV